MTSYPLPCPYCDRVVDSMDSMSDTRSEMDDHLALKHPDLPDPFGDARWSLHGLVDPS